jgi:hypothetical protein
MLIVISVNTEAKLIINSSLSQEYDVNNNEIIEGEIIAKNSSNRTIKVRLYKRDYTFNAAGENYYEKPGSHHRSNAGWINIYKRKITIKPYETKTIGYQIKVPKANKFNGTYWSMIMVEEYGNSREKQTSAEKIAVSQNIRYGIQVITDFNKKQEVRLEYQNPMIKEVQENRYLFEVDVFNKGVKALKASLKLLLLNSNNGEILKEVKLKPRRIYPDTSINVSEEFKINKDNKYKLILLLGNDEKGFFGKEYLFEINDD